MKADARQSISTHRNSLKASCFILRFDFPTAGAPGAIWRQGAAFALPWSSVCVSKVSVGISGEHFFWNWQCYLSDAGNDSCRDEHLKMSTPVDQGKNRKNIPKKSFLAHGFQTLATLSKSRSVIAVGFSHVLAAKAWMLGARNGRTSRPASFNPSDALSHQWDLAHGALREICRKTVMTLNHMAYRSTRSSPRIVLEKGCFST